MTKKENKLICPSCGSEMEGREIYITKDGTHWWKKPKEYKHVLVEYGCCTCGWNW